MVPEETLAADFVLFCGYFTLPALRGAPTLALMNRVRAAGAVSSSILTGIPRGGARRVGTRSQDYCRSLMCSYRAMRRLEVSPDSKIP